MIELIRERLVDFKLYRYADVQNPEREDTVDEGVEALHELYSTIFTRFNALWVESNPRDVMAFPAIFQALKDTIRSELLERSFRY